MPLDVPNGGQLVFDHRTNGSTLPYGSKYLFLHGIFSCRCHMPLLYIIAKWHDLLKCLLLVYDGDRQDPSDLSNLLREESIYQI